MSEEMADVIMDYAEALMRHGITPQELKRTYIQKFEKNMTR